MLKNYLTKEFNIGINDCDNNLNLTLSALQKFLCETSMHHAELMEFGYNTLKTSGLMWVISDMEIHINQTPQFMDNITITTYPLEPKVISTERVFDVFNSKKQKIAYAISTWCVLNETTRRPVKISAVPHKDPKYKTSEYAKQKFEFCDKSCLKKIGVAEVFLSDLDANNHMNNTKYTTKILDCLSPEEFKNLKPKTVQLKFIREVKYGSKLEISKYESQSKIYFEIKNTTTNEVAFEAIIEQ